MEIFFKRGYWAGICWFFLVVLALPAAGQKSKAALERKKRKNQEFIASTNKVLDEVRSKKRSSVGKLQAINRQLAARRQLVRNIENELNHLREDVSDMEIVINSLEQDLQRLKKEYSEMLYAASKMGQYDKLVLLFSSGSINQFIQRMKYFQEYSDARNEQLEAIRQVQKALQNEQAKLNNTKKEKRQLLEEAKTENQKLYRLQQEKDELVEELKSREQDLLAKLEKRKKANERLEQMIADLVEKELEDARREKRISESTGKIELTPEAQSVANSFKASKSKLSWPVSKGFISSHFGKQPHPVLKNVQIENLGINIQSNEGQPVRAVFDGEVTSVATVPGMPSKVVIVQHGDYYTVYNNVKDVAVQTGQKVERKDRIGTVFTDGDGISELKFQIWKNNQRLNPESWLYTKNN